MKLLLTAFGPFGGRPENASALVLRALRKSMPDLRGRILPVDAVIAPARLRHALRVLRPDALVMLGEAAGSKTIRLETTAWNRLDFPIPDIAGRKPADRAISRSGPQRLDSTLPLPEIHSGLDRTGHEVIFSDDAGRYLCNQLFYTALESLRRDGVSIPAGFIHLPLAKDYATERATDAIAAALRVLGAK
jgi:pyroglutamyl-peptidase